MKRNRVAPRFDHVAYCVHNLEAVVDLMQVELGGIPHRYEEIGFNYGKLRYANGELIEFIFGEQVEFIQRFLTKRGPSLHHMTFIVCKNRAQLVQYRAMVVGGMGLHATQVSTEDESGWSEFFISPRSLDGTLIQLAATNHSTRQDEHCWPTKPRTRAPVNPPCRVLGVEIHIQRRSRPMFRRLLGRVLGGRMRAASTDCDVYSYPEGPMNIYCRAVPEGLSTGIKYLLVDRELPQGVSSPLLSSLKSVAVSKL